jgi:cyclase
MFRHRAIPCLLLKGDGLVKTVNFRHPKYVGDPINAVKLFNDLEVDELLFLDITATPEGREPGYERVRDIASECFMPVCYGGGVRTVGQARRLFQLGVEKVALTTAAAANPSLISQLAQEFGSQSIIVGIDVKRDWMRRSRVYVCSGAKNTGLDPLDHAREAERLGAGEILLNSIDCDGMRQGYDLALVEKVCRGVSVPVVACGGAGDVNDLAAAIRAGASAAAAGSLFVFHGPHRAVLINYPSQAEYRKVFGTVR